MARTPKPTNVHFLNGNPGKKARGQNEPQPDYLETDEAAEVKEKFLTCNEAKIYWDFLYKHLRETRLVTVLDVPALIELCENAAMSWRMRKKRESILSTNKMPIITGEKGGYQFHPCITLEKQAAERAERWIKEFGGTPAARTRIEMAERQLDMFDQLDMVAIPVTQLHGKGSINLPANNAS